MFVYVILLLLRTKHVYFKNGFFVFKTAHSVLQEDSESSDIDQR